MIVNSLRPSARLINSTAFYPFSQRNRKRHFFKVEDHQQERVPVVYPKQYPSNLVDAGPMIARGRPVRFLTPKGEIPEAKMMSNDDAVVR